MTLFLGAFSPLLKQAARAGDEIAAPDRPGRGALKVKGDVPLTVSFCGALMQHDSLLSPLFLQAVSESDRNYALRSSGLPPALGAAMLDVTPAKTVLSAGTLESLQNNDVGEGVQ